MTPRSLIRVAVALMLGVAAAAAQEPIETRGAWRLVADGPDLALRTTATTAPDSTLSLFCRKEQQPYVFEMKRRSLAAQSPDEDIRIGFKVVFDDHILINIATGLDGT